jgi:hypothetical protein
VSTLPTNVVIQSIVDLLTEAYAGPSDPSATWFIDNEPDSGVFGILAGISAAEASTSVDGSGESGTTIASHTEHLRWSLGMMNSAIRGESLGDWKESWQVLSTDETGWDLLRSALRTEFETLREALHSQTHLPEEYLTGTIALLPHAAYHLGTIRQMVERVKG